MKRQNLLIIFSLLATLSAFAAEFKNDGTISGKTGTLYMSPKGAISLRGKNGAEMQFMLSAVHPEFKWFSIGNLKDVKMKISASEKKVEASGTLPEGKNVQGAVVRWNMVLLPDGKTARLTYEFVLKKEQPFFCNPSLEIYNHKYLGKERSYVIDGERMAFDFSSQILENKTLYRGKAKRIVYESTPESAFMVLCPGESLRTVLRQLYSVGGKRFLSLLSLFFSKDNRISLDIPMDEEQHFSSGAYRIGELDFAPNKFRLPDYSISRNLIQNPSFESGFDFWRNVKNGVCQETASESGDFFVVDGSTAVHGKNSLKMLLKKDQNCSIPSTFAIPSETGKKYVLSFYAKTDSPELVHIRTTGYGHGGRDLVANQLPPHDFTITNEWKRYHYTFTSRGKILTASFRIKSMGKQEKANLWIDAFQLERGEKVTPFEGPTLEATFRTTNRDNLFQPGEKVNGTICLVSEVPRRGKVKYKMRDFFDRTVASGTFDFSTQGAYHPFHYSVPGLDELDFGLYILEMEVEIPNGFRNTFYHRLGKIRFMNGTHKHAVLLAGADSEGSNEWNRKFILWRKMGLGSMMHFEARSPAYCKLMEQHGVLILGTIYDEGKTVLGKYRLSLSGDREKGVLAIKDTDLPEIEKEAFLKAGKFPMIKYWKLINEPMVHTPEEMKILTRVYKASIKGILRANPNAKIVSSDHANMKLGMSFLDEHWKTSSSFIDVFAVHPYRQHPESPDLDDDIRLLIRKVDSCSPGLPIWFTEGNYYTNYMIPGLEQDALDNKTICLDRYRGGDLTYDLGFGEKVSLAHCMRYRLMVFKYASRIGMDVDWNVIGDNHVMGLDMNPKAGIFTVNTLANLLGSADFKADVPYGENIRCYLFEDELKRPVAVLWNFHQDIFRSGQPFPRLNLSGITTSYELLNLMGGREKVPEKGFLPITGYPVFLRGKPGTTETFLKQLNSLTLAGGNGGPVKIRGEIENGTVRIIMKNLRNTEKKGLLEIKKNGESVLKQYMELGPLAEFVYTKKLSKAMHNDWRKDLYEFSLQPSEKEKAITQKFCFEYFSVPRVPENFKIDDQLEKWSGKKSLVLENLLTYPPVSPQKVVPYAGKKDLSAQAWFGYNRENLYLTISVTDNVYCPAKGGIGNAYTGDGLQIYFDSFANASNNPRSGFEFDDDDQAYNVRAVNGKVEVCRTVAPFVQLAFNEKGIDPRIKGIFRKNETGYTVSLVFPLKSILPVELKSGKSIGVSILVNDNDGDYRKHALSLNRGREPFQNPKEYPVMVLE